MPKILTPEIKLEKWNLYMPLDLRLRMHRKLSMFELQRKPSALIRALIIMFVNGDIDETKLLVLIEQETYIKQDGTISVL